MTPHPIPPHIYALTLQYIVPPQAPLPPHLISTALQQRHYFLNVSHHEDPYEYFLWPKSLEDGVGKRLADIPHEDDRPMRTITYLHSPEGLLQCRVGLGDELQVVFTFEESSSGDEESSWRYHDVIVARPASEGFPTLAAALKAHEDSEETEEDENRKAADFWSGWDDADDTPGVVSTKPPETAGKEDDAYFAQYSDVITSIPDLTVSSQSQRNSLISYSDLPQIPTEGYNTPARRTTGSSTTSDVHRTPLVPRAPLPEHPEESMALLPEDEAVLSIIRGAYTLWKRTRPLGDHAEFLDLASRAILPS